MFRCNANVRENKSLAGSRSPPGRHTAARGSAPREAGTEQRRAAAPLPPAGHCSPGKPRPHAGHLLFLKLGVFRGKYVPAGLGHLPLHRPSPRPWPSSCSGRALSARSRGSAAGPGGRVGRGAAGPGSHGGPAMSQLLARWAREALALGTPSFVCNEGASSNTGALCSSGTHHLPRLLLSFPSRCWVCCRTRDRQCLWAPCVPPQQVPIQEAAAGHAEPVPKAVRSPGSAWGRAEGQSGARGRWQRDELVPAPRRGQGPGLPATQAPREVL